MENPILWEGPGERHAELFPGMLHLQGVSLCPDWYSWTGWGHWNALLQHPGLLAFRTSPALTAAKPPSVLPVLQDHRAILFLDAPLPPGVHRDIRNENWQPYSVAFTSALSHKTLNWLLAALSWGKVSSLCTSRVAPSCKGSSAEVGGGLISPPLQALAHLSGLLMCKRRSHVGNAGWVTGRRLCGQSRQDARIHPGSATRSIRQMGYTGFPALESAWHCQDMAWAQPGSTALCYSEHRVDASSGSCSTTGKEGVLSFKQALLPYAPSYKVPDSSRTQGTVVSRVESLAFYCFGVFLSPKFEASLTFC